MDLLLPYRCSEVQKECLEKQFTKEEIITSFFSIIRNKTCGPDGYSVKFVIGCWSIIGVEVTEAVEEFFFSGKLLKQWNAITLVLILKINNASSTSDFRPISCLDTVYKVISKLLASILYHILSHVISPSQYAFMPRRLLGELLATKIVHGYNWKNIEPRAMLKIDLRKTFDSVRWDFIISTLRALEILKIFVIWISQCISTTTSQYW